MMSQPILTRILALLCVLALIGGGTSPLYASMLGTDVLLDAEVAGVERERLLGFLERNEVQGQLQALGVTADSAAERVARMSDSEVRLLNEHFDELPAGGASVLGVLATVFIVLVITDALGYTDIFPFVGQAR